MPSEDRPTKQQALGVLQRIADGLADGTLEYESGEVIRYPQGAEPEPLIGFYISVRKRVQPQPTYRTVMGMDGIRQVQTYEFKPAPWQPGDSFDPLTGEPGPRRGTLIETKKVEPTKPLGREIDIE